MKIKKRGLSYSAIHDVYGTRPVYNNEGTLVRTEFYIWDYGWEWVNSDGYEPYDES